VIGAPKAAWGVATALVVACGADSKPNYEYMPDMARGPAYKAFAPNPATRDGLTLQRPVPGTIARGYRPFHYLAGEQEAARAGRELSDPLRATTATLEEGKALYQIYCLVCHGERGLGDGPVAAKIPAPPSYKSERLLEFSAGRMFHVITMGSGKMPSYAAQLGETDRWKIVTYVRASLQGLSAPTNQEPVAP
jgi:mono/diheme cytochrome c family protein